MVVGLVFIYTIINMGILSRQFNWFQDGNFKIQVIFFGIVLVAVFALFSLKDKKIISIIITVFFLGNSASQVFLINSKYESNPKANTEKNVLSFLEERPPKHRPNVYLLVYDSYVSNETMIEYGIDNSDQEQYLLDHNFTIYPHTYSLGAGTLSSMSMLFSITAYLTSNSWLILAGDGIVHNQFRFLGYQTYGIFPSDYEFRGGSGSYYDISYPENREVSPSKLLISAILIGEFRFDLGFYDQTYGQFLSNKTRELIAASEGQAFFYSHSYYPGHSQNSGMCLPDENERFADRLALANWEMKEDVSTIIKYDPEAIIIIAGDHGPYLTKNCSSSDKAYDLSEITRLDIQDRFGTFLAIRWPTDEYQDYDEITVLQDLFPAVFAYLYEDPSLLNLKVPPETRDTTAISGASVRNGIIIGGLNDGQPLFTSSK